MTFAGARWFATAAGAALLALVLGGPGGLAQDATPVSDVGSSTVGDGGIPHPAHIHAGTCANLDPSPLFPLADVVIPAAGGETGAATPGATPVTGGGMATPVAATGEGGAGAIPAGASVTAVETGLSDLLAADHAVNVHLSYEEVNTYIACGTIGGQPNANGDLFIGLKEQNSSGYSGIAWFHDNGDGTTIVTVFLGMGLHEGDTGSEATPEA
jgi:hypothetical protein